MNCRRSLPENLKTRAKCTPCLGYLARFSAQPSIRDERFGIQSVGGKSQFAERRRKKDERRQKLENERRYALFRLNSVSRSSIFRIAVVSMSETMRFACSRFELRKRNYLRLRYTVRHPACMNHDTKLAWWDCGFRSINSFGGKAGSQRTFRVSFSSIATVFSFFYDALRYLGRPKDDTEISRSLLDRGRIVLIGTITFKSDSTYLEKYL